MLATSSRKRNVTGICHIDILTVTHRRAARNASPLPAYDSAHQQGGPTY